MNIILFGATGGIGKRLAYELSNKHKIFIGSRTKINIDSMISDISYRKKSIDGSVVDISDFDSIDNFLDKGNDFLGSIDCIINCVGSLMLKPAHLINEKELENIFKINVFSCFGILKYGFKFLKNNGGSFIFFSSAAARIGLKNHDAISAAKGAISSLVTSAASTYSKYNIRVNAIAPGLVETPLTQRIVNNKNSLDYSKKLHALNRIGKPENFVPLIDSLIDQRSDWITGQTFNIDGGLSNVK